MKILQIALPVLRVDTAISPIGVIPDWFLKVPEKRHHRGPHPEDETNFAPAAAAALSAAVAELSWLLTRSYAANSALKLVGDRHNLTARQRIAVMRSSCTDAALAQRASRRLAPAQVAGRELWIDGYNVLTTVEAGLAGGALLRARDGALRDMASMHGTWRKVRETTPALDLIGRALAELGTGPSVFWLDSPVSNSGRLRTIMAALAQNRGWPWRIELTPNADKVLIASDQIVASADSVILDACRAWFPLAEYTVEHYVPQARLLDLAHVTARAGP